MLVFGYFVDGPKPGGSGLFSRPAISRALPATPAANIPAGFDAAPPSNWNAMTFQQRQAWVRQHQLTQAERQARELREREERQRQQAQAQAQAENEARRGTIRKVLGHLPMTVYALGFLIWGFVQHHLRWRDILAGIKWHTYSRGVPHLKALLGRFMPETYILRFADAVGVFLAGVAALVISRALALWLILSAVAMMLVEQYVWEVQLNRELDILDNLTDAESALESYRHWQKNKSGQATGPAPGIEENGGLLSTAAVVPDLLQRRKDRRSKLHKAQDAYIERIERELEAQRLPVASSLVAPADDEKL
jgi:hypothetical protein